MTLLLTVLVFSIACGSQGPAKPVALEFRLAQGEEAPGFETLRVLKNGQAIYLADEVALDGRHVLTAEAKKGLSGFDVLLSFDERGTELFGRLTSDNVGMKMAILVDGELVAAPRIAAPITQGLAMINGDFSEDEARRIAEGLPQH